MTTYELIATVHFKEVNSIIPAAQTIEQALNTSHTKIAIRELRRTED